jgi:capsular polysaccharide transport system permease protein
VSDVVGLSSEAAGELTAERVLAEVDALQTAGARDQAIELLEQALQRLPDRPLADRLIMLHTADNRIERAVDIAWADLERNGADAARLGRLAQMASQIGDAERALEAARQAVAVGGGDAADWSLVAALAFRHNRFEEAERAARSAIRRDPAGRGPRRLLASIMTRLDRGEELVRDLSEAVQAAPRDAYLRYELSSAYALSARLADARREGRRALDLNPGNLEFSVYLSGIYAQLGESEEAIALLRSVVERAPDDSRAHYSLAHLLWPRGEQDAAIFHASQAAALNPAELGYRDLYLAILEQRTSQPPVARGDAKPTTGGMFDALRDPNAPAGASSVGVLANRARVVFALMLRDMRTRHANTRLGFVWAIAEPLLHLSVLAVVFSVFNRGHPPLGEDWFFFYATGVIPFLMWSHVTSNGFHGLVANVQILQIPAISRLDVLLASALVDLVVAVAMGSVMFWAFWMAGTGPAPRDPLAAIEAIAVLWAFAFGLSMINATVETVNGSWLKVWPSIIRLQYFTAGIFYVPQEMPDWLRDVLVLNPLLLCLEWFRTGFFDQYAPPWLDKEYCLIVTLLVILAGLVVETAFRRRQVR